MKVSRFLLFIFFIFLTFPIANTASNDLPAKYCLAQNNWKKLFSKNGITVYSQKAPGSDVLALKASGILKAPTDQIMEVLRKIEIAKEWVPHTDNVVLVKDVSDIETITYSVNSMPWPFADRSLLLHNKLRLDSEKKCFVVEIRSVNSETDLIKDNYVRANMYCGQIIIRPHVIGQTEMELILFVDPRGYIPTWLVNMAQKSLPYDYLISLEKKASQTNYELRPSYKKRLDQLFSLPRN